MSAAPNMSPISRRRRSLRRVLQGRDFIPRSRKTTSLLFGIAALFALISSFAASGALGGSKPILPVEANLEIQQF